MVRQTLHPDAPLTLRWIRCPSSHTDLRHVSWAVPDKTRGRRQTNIPTDYHNRRPGLVNASYARATFVLPPRDVQVLANETARRFEGGAAGSGAKKSLAELTHRIYGRPVCLLGRKFSLEEEEHREALDIADRVSHAWDRIALKADLRWLTRGRRR